MMFERESIDRLAKSLQQEKPASGPLDLQLLPTPRCNASCVFCPLNAVPDPLLPHVERFRMYKEDLPGGLLDRLADDLYHLGGLKRVTITGGEPLLYSHLIPAVFMFATSFPGAELTLVTNGILLKRFAGFFVHAGLHNLSVSVNAGTVETYARQNPRSPANTLEEIIAGVSAVTSAKKAAGRDKPKVALSVVLTRHSAGDVAALYELGRKSGADAVTFIPLVRFEIAGTSVNSSLEVNAETFMRFMDAMAEYGAKAQAEGFYLGYAGTKKDGGVLSSAGLYRDQPCYSGHTFAAIYPGGDVRTCCNCEPVMGNLKEKSFVEIWESGRYRLEREKMLKIGQNAPLEGCLCDECGYLYENREFHRRLQGG